MPKFAEFREYKTESMFEALEAIDCGTIFTVGENKMYIVDANKIKLVREILNSKGLKQ